MKEHDLNVVAVLSGNRNFEGRIHPLVRSSYLASPPLVVAYALAGTVHIERIHRSNLVMMGIIPLEFMPGETMASVGVTGQETFTIRGLDKLAPKAKLTVETTSPDGRKRTFTVLSRVDDPTDLEYVRHGGIL